MMYQKKILLLLFVLLIALPVFSLNFVEDWESGNFNTNAWSFEDGQGNWEIFEYQGNPGNSVRFAGYPNLNSYTHTLVTPILTAPEDSNIYLIFDYIGQVMIENGNEELTILYKTLGEDWQELITYNTSTPGNGIDWHNEIINLTAYAPGNNFKIGFKAHGLNTFDLMRWNLDNIIISSEITIEPVVISGFVTDIETGNALEDVTVTLGAVSDTTDSEGYYELSNMPGMLQIIAEKEQYITYNNEMLFESGETYNIDIQLIPEASILPPADFQVNVDSNNVTLSWQNPDQETSITEGFENWPPENWTIKHSTSADGSDLQEPTDDSWFQVNMGSFMGSGMYYIHSGNYSCGLEYFSPDFNWLISPQFTVSSDTELSFWLWYYSDELYVSKFHVYAKLNNEWQVLQSWLSEADNNEMQSSVNIDLSTYAGEEIEIAFVSEYNDGYEIAIDDIFIGSSSRATPDGYKVYRNGQCLTWDLHMEETYVDSNLHNGEYNYHVTAFYSEVESAPTEEVSVDICCLEMPTVYMCEFYPHYNGGIQYHSHISWSDVTYANGYNVYRNGEVINNELLIESIYDDFEFANPSIYHYNITSVFSYGESNFTQTDTLECFLPALNCYGIPFEDHIYLGWDAPAVTNPEEELLGYNVYINCCDLVNDELITENEFNIYDFDPNETVTYSVSAVYSCGESRPSLGISVQGGYDIILPPSNLSAELSDNDVYLTWQRNSFNGEWIKHCDETVGGSFSMEDNQNYSAFVHYNNADLGEFINMEIEELAFWPTNGNASYTITIYMPDFFNPDLFMPMSEIILDSIDVNAWNVIPINGGSIQYELSQLKIEITCDDNSQPFLAYDNQTATNERSDLIYTNEQWQNLSDYGIDGNWKVKLLAKQVSGVGGERSSLIALDHYKLMRNDEVISLFNHAYEVFNDQDLDYGTYNYSICGVYNIMDVMLFESDYSESLEVIISEAVYPPENLQYEILESSVVLTWDAPQSDLQRELSGYSVFVDSLFFAETDTTTLELSDLINGTTYQVGVKAIYETDESEMISTEFVYTGTDSDDLIPLKTDLFANYPNPFNPSTNIAFSLSEASEVELVIYNIKGQIVKTLINESMTPGNYRTLWKGLNNSGNKVASGVYFYRLRTNNYDTTKKMILMK